MSVPDMEQKQIIQSRTVSFFQLVHDNHAIGLFQILPPRCPHKQDISFNPASPLAPVFSFQLLQNLTH